MTNDGLITFAICINGERKIWSVILNTQGDYNLNNRGMIQQRKQWKNVDTEKNLVCYYLPITWVFPARQLTIQTIRSFRGLYVICQ